MSRYGHEYLYIEVEGEGRILSSEPTDDDRWEVNCEWRPISGRWEPISVTIRARGDARRVTASDVRSLPLGEMMDRSRSRLISTRQGALDRADVSPTGDAERDVAIRNRIEAMQFEGPQRGQALTPADLDAVAAVYRRAWANGETVTRAVQDAFHLSRGGAAKRIMRARDAGLLDDVGPRR